MTGWLDEVTATLGPWAHRADAVQAAMGDEPTDLRFLEASLRGGAGQGIRGGRMMIERLSPAVAGRIVSDGLGVGVPPVAALLCSMAEAHGLPMIAGWDTGGDAPMAKLYLNASAADAEVRARLAVSLECPEAPHVVGANLSQSGDVVTKAYVQSESVPSGAAPALATAAARAPDAITWFVTSIDMDSRTPRAHFAALAPHAASAVALVRSLPGWGAAEDEAVLDRGPIVSVGFDAAPPHPWTVYWRLAPFPRPAPRPDPMFRLSDGINEIGVHITPLDPDETAYARTRDHAISYRVRHGAPRGAHTGEAMDWVARVVSEVEAGKGTPGPSDFTKPPAPWKVLG